MDNSIYKAGYTVGVSDYLSDDYTNCPHTQGTLEHIEWFNGWNAGYRSHQYI